MPSSHGDRATLLSSGLAAGVNRRRFLQFSGLAGLGLGSAALLSACGGSSSSGSTSAAASAAAGSGDFGEIGIQLSWIKNIEFSGEYFADSKGYYSDGGFSKVNLIAGGASAATAESMVASKKAWVGLSSPTGTAPAIAKGAKLKTVGATYQKSPFCIVSLAKTNIAEPGDMIGKKIGVQQGINTTILQAVCKANNVDYSKINVVPVQYDPTVVAKGEVDGFFAYITNEPILLKSQGNEVTTMLFADYGLPLVAETFIVLQDTIDKDRDKLKAFLKAEIQGWNDAVADPAGSAKLAVETYGKDQKLDIAEQTEEINATIPLIVSDDTKKNGLFTMTDQLVADNIKALGEAGIKATADELFDLSILEEVYKENPDLIKG